MYKWIWLVGILIVLLVVIAAFFMTTSIGSGNNGVTETVTPTIVRVTVSP